MILELCNTAPDSAAYRRELRYVLLKLFPFDAYCVNTADPATLLVTGSVGDGLPWDKASRFFEIEYLEPDYSKMADLAVRDSNVAILGEETDGRPEKSARMREVLLPIGYAHEIRCALSLGGCCWGYLHLFRGPEQPDFSRVEAEMIRLLSGDIALGLRLGVLRGASVSAPPEAPGLVLLAPDGSVESMNGAAARWLEELEGELRDPLPHSVLTVAQGARRAPDGSEVASSCRVQTRAGHWLMVHGTFVGGRVAIVIERARPHDIAPVILRAYELSRREEGVVQLLLRGMSNDEIAVALGLSTYTVKDHLKSIFRKVGTRSRAELSARIFAEQYIPRIVERKALASDGWFVD